MNHVLVTGAPRGMGLEFCRQYLARGHHVFAGHRAASNLAKLQALAKDHPGRLTLIPLDISDEDSIRSAARLVAKHTDKLDILINNAGIGGTSRDTGKTEELGNFHFDDAWLVLRTMAVGPLLLAQECFELLKKSGHARVGNVSSGYGSIAGNTHRSPYYYSAAKTCLHQLFRSFAFDAKPHHILTVLLDPGWVQTDMGGPSAPLPVAESVGGMIKVIDDLTPDTTGSFQCWVGKPVPW